ncbi:enterobactin synthase subunit EntD [Vagococcus sp. WN89Y]|uniref:enterobactin synthase subunit EntD n=1 Tax=Vagococcus sp. WN89Y TaxID=3457258 RepID=UPI003FCD0417
MDTSHHSISFAGHTLHQVDFDSSTLTPGCLLWLAHHERLARFARKRQAEHLAGRIAAVHALRARGETTVPGIGAAGEPLWPAGVFGSITHSASRALAVVASQPVGIDLEVLFSPSLCSELADCIVSPQERVRLERCSLPFALALTLVFSAKESLYKAFSHLARPFPGFDSAELLAIDERTLTLRPLATFSPTLGSRLISVHWQSDEVYVMTLASE